MTVSVRIIPGRSVRPAAAGPARVRRALLLGLIAAGAVQPLPGAPVLPVAAAVAVAVAPAPAQVPEYNAKAGYLLLFTRYVEWPAEAFPGPTDPLVIGVLGANPFGDVLEHTVHGLKSQGRPIEVRYVQSVEEAARCHVVFIARGQDLAEAAWLRALRGRPVLTVNESERGLERGPVVFLALEESPRGTKVAFYASQPAAHAAGLKISASMLASARKIIREPGDKKGTP